MSDAVTWIFRLEDELAGPARGMDTALGGVEARALGVNRALRSLDAGMAIVARETSLVAQNTRATTGALDGIDETLRKSALHMQRYHEEMKGVVSGLKETRSAADDTESSLAKMLKLDIAGRVAGKVFDVASAGIGAGWEFAKFGIGEAAWKQSMMLSLGTQLGSEGAAKSFWKELTAVEKVVPFPVKDVTGTGQQLLAAGLNQNESKNVLLALSDLVSMSGGRGNLGQVAFEVQRILGADRVTAQEMMVLAGNTGGAVNQTAIAAALAKERNIGLEEARAILQQHGVHGREMVSLLLDIAETRGGGVLGTTAAELGTKSFDGVMSTLQSNLERLFQDIDLGPLTKVIGRVNGLLGGELGHDFGTSVANMFGDEIDKFIKPYEGPGGQEKLQDDLVRLFGVGHDIADALLQMLGFMPELLDIGSSIEQKILGGPISRDEAYQTIYDTHLSAVASGHVNANPDETGWRLLNASSEERKSRVRRQAEAMVRAGVETWSQDPERIHQELLGYERLASTTDKAGNFKIHLPANASDQQVEELKDDLSGPRGFLSTHHGLAGRLQIVRGDTIINLTQNISAPVHVTGSASEDAADETAKHMEELHRQAAREGMSQISSALGGT